MATPNKIIVGLGNPGADYCFNRHNIGFMALDVLADGAAWQKKFKGLICQKTFQKPQSPSTCGRVEKTKFFRGGVSSLSDATPLLLFKPQTFMNLSGEAVQEALNYYKLTAQDVIVFHDDIDLVSSHVRVKQGGGHGGHNGLRSLDAHIGKDYWRVRLGVGRPDHKGEVTDYVLGNFAKADRTWLEPLLGAIPPALPLLLEGKQTDFIKALIPTAR